MKSDNKNKTKKITLVATCYNEGVFLAKFVAEAERVLGPTEYSAEFIFVDDASNDNSKEEIKKICSERSDCKYIFHEKNVGRGGSVKEGLLMSGTAYAGFFDIDLEVSAKYIPDMLRLLEEGADVASVERVYDDPRGPYGLLRSVASAINKKLMRYVLKIRSSDPENGYKFFNMHPMRPIIENTQDPGWFWDVEVIAMAERAGKNIKFVPGDYIRDKNKKSTVRIFADSVAHLKGLYKFKKNL
jgi:glycosyltransferase involved in cell wall biosynthesis